MTWFLIRSKLRSQGTKEGKMSPQKSIFRKKIGDISRTIRARANREKVGRLWRGLASDLGKGCHISIEASWWDKHVDIRVVSVSQCVRKLLTTLLSMIYQSSVTPNSINQHFLLDLLSYRWLIYHQLLNVAGGRQPYYAGVWWNDISCFKSLRLLLWPG